MRYPKGADAQSATAWTIRSFEKRSKSQGFIDALNFFTEVLPCGVVGSFILEKLPAQKRRTRFAFKHHYILQTLDAEIEHRIFEAIRKGAFVKINYLPKKSAAPREINCLPLKIFQSVENGRLYLCASESRNKNIACIRVDRIQGLEECGRCGNVETRRRIFDEERKYVWGVSFPNKDERGRQKQRVRLTVHIGEGEEYIWQRLLREKRCGNVERLDKNTARFWIDVYDASELKPWARSFIGRIADIDFGSAEMNSDFASAFEKTCEMYGV